MSRVAQGPGPPDGALEGLAKAALDPQTDSIPLFSQKQINGRETLGNSLFLSHSFTQSHIKHTSCDVLDRRCNLNRPGKVGQRPCNIWQVGQEFTDITLTLWGGDSGQGRGHHC